MTGMLNIILLDFNVAPVMIYLYQLTISINQFAKTDSSHNAVKSHHIYNCKYLFASE